MFRLRINLLLSLFFILFFSFNANAQNDILGAWKTEPKNGSWGYIQFKKCGSKYCGTLVNGGGKKVDKSLFGILIVKGMKKNGALYDGGMIYDADAKKWYISRMQLISATRLKVSGCVLGGLICGGQTWKRQ